MPKHEPKRPTEAPESESDTTGTPGPKPDVLRIEGVEWEEAVQKMLRTPPPPEGWPEEVKKPPKKKPGAE